MASRPTLCRGPTSGVPDQKIGKTAGLA